MRLFAALLYCSEESGVVRVMVGLLVLGKPFVMALEITAEYQHMGFSNQCRVATCQNALLATGVLVTHGASVNSTE